MLKLDSFIFSPIQENTYVIYNEKADCIIIDPGCYFDNEKEELANYIKESALNPVMLLNTHCHLDHVFGNKFVAEKYQLTLKIHEKEKEMLDIAPASGLLWNMPFDNYAGELVYLKEGDIVKLGDDELKILFLPGHSPGSIGFYCEKQNFIIAGDVLFNRSIGRTDLPLGDYGTLIKSISDKLLVLPDEVKVYSGHGPVTTIGEERVNNPYLK